MKEGFYEWLRDVRKVSSRRQKWVYGVIYELYRMGYNDKYVLYGDKDEIISGICVHRKYSGGMYKQVGVALNNYRKFAGGNVIRSKSYNPEIKLSWSRSGYVQYLNGLGYDKEKADFYYNSLKTIQKGLEDEDYIVNNPADLVVQRYVEVRGVKMSNISISTYRNAICNYQGLCGKVNFCEVRRDFYNYLIGVTSNQKAEYFANLIQRFLSLGVSENDLLSGFAGEIVDTKISKVMSHVSHTTLASYRAAVYHYQKFKLGAKIPPNGNYRVYSGRKAGYGLMTPIDGFEEYYHWCIDNRHYSPDVSRHNIGVVRRLMEYYGSEEQVLAGDTRDVVEKYLASIGRDVTRQIKCKPYRSALRSYREFKGVTQ